MTRILFATDRSTPGLTADDRLAAQELRRRGAHVEPVVWNDPGPDHAAADAIVIRSCWDYHLHGTAFGEWIDRLEGAGTALINGPSLVRWNLHKRYIADLERRGVPVVPTVTVPAGDARTLREVIDGTGWDEAVVKPAVSLSAWETWRARSADADLHERRYRGLLARGDVLVQQFIPQITNDGEWSLIFFGDRFSHAILKRPAPGDFRVQTEHGGSAIVQTPGDDLVDAAARVVGMLPHPPVYARIDGVAIEGTFLLMEAECIDPVLFLADHPPAAGVFADSILARIAGT